MKTTNVASSMRVCRIGPVVIAVCVAFFTSATASWADIINGDFSTGDFTGWTRSAIDDTDSAVAVDPFVSIVTQGGNSAVGVRTHAFNQGLFVATLEQPFAIGNTGGQLSFDFDLPTIVNDGTGAGSSPFGDSIVVSLSNGTDVFSLLMLDRLGVTVNPFETLAGPTVTIDRADLTNVDASTITAFSGVFHNRRERRSTSNVEVTNVSSGQIDVPLILTVESISDPTVTVANADGSTTPDGAPLFDLTTQAGSGDIAPGAAVDARTLELNNPLLRRFGIDTSVSSQAGGPSPPAPGATLAPATLPFGLLGLPEDPAFDLGFSIDVSSLAGQSVTLFVDISSEDDGSQLMSTLDNFRLTAAVPEPLTSSLVALGFTTMFLRGSKRRSRERR